MRVLFLGETEGNTGPANVNRELVAHWPTQDEVVTIRRESKLCSVVAGVVKGLACDVVVSPGAGWVEISIHVALALLGRPVVSFNHGYVPYENKVNGLGYSRLKVRAIEWHLRNSAAIVANSESQMRFLAEHLDGFSGELTYTNLGVEPFDLGLTGREACPPVIAVSGGTRPIKANEVVARAVRLLREEGIDCELRVYGRSYSENAGLQSAFESGFARPMGQVSQEEFIRQLGEASVFVMNSRHESFGLSVLDALRAGCSVLLSKNCGVAGVFDLRDSDVVQDCEDESEVARKIEGLLICSNAERLYQSLDFEKLDWDSASGNLREACRKVVKHAR